MESNGTPLKILPNETPEELDYAIAWIMQSIRNDVSS
jgi:hypothetical protein